MKGTKKYTTAKALRIALEDRLKTIGDREGKDFRVLRKQVCFERLLSRLFHKNSIPWVIKGGFAMQLRISKSRSTKDIDLALKELQLISPDQNEVGNALRDMLQTQVSHDLGDFFEFIVSGPTTDLDGAPYTLPRPEGVTNTRVKDLIDMVLLISMKKMDQTNVKTAIKSTFERRDTHKLNFELKPPPSTWVLVFDTLATECDIKSDMNSAFELVHDYVKTLI